MKEFSELKTPANLKYAKSHEWLAPARPYRIGVTDFAQDQLGDITYVELPEVGALFARESEFGSLESIKSVSGVYLPVDGKIVAVNDKLRDDPALVNQDPYGEGWLIEIEPDDAAQLDAMLTADAYLASVKEQ